MAFLGYLAFGLDVIDKTQPRIANSLALRDYFFFPSLLREFGEMEKAQNVEILLFLFYDETVVLLFYLPDGVKEEVERGKCNAQCYYSMAL